MLPDGIGHGKSSKPSDGLHAQFPALWLPRHAGGEYQLLTQGLGVNHARLIMGTSMGGMHTWLWGELHPEFMDALMPLASLPTQVSGRNRVWRRLDQRCDSQRSGMGRRVISRAAPSLRTALRGAVAGGQ